MQEDREKKNVMGDRNESIQSLPLEHVSYHLQSLEMAPGVEIWSISQKKKKKVLFIKLEESVAQISLAFTKLQACFCL